MAEVKQRGFSSTCSTLDFDRIYSAMMSSSINQSSRKLQKPTNTAILDISCIHALLLCLTGLSGCWKPDIVIWGVTVTPVIASWLLEVVSLFLYFYGLETSVCVLNKADRAARSISVLRVKDSWHFMLLKSCFIMVSTFKLIL